MNLEAVLEGILFVSGEDGLSLEQITNVLEINKEELINIINNLNENYNNDNRGLKLEYFGEKLKIVTKKEHSAYYKTFNLLQKINRRRG